MRRRGFCTLVHSFRKYLVAIVYSLYSGCNSNNHRTVKTTFIFTVLLPTPLSTSGPSNNNYTVIATTFTVICSDCPTLTPTPASTTAPGQCACMETERYTNLTLTSRRMQSIFGEREPEFHGHNVLSPMTKRTCTLSSIAVADLGTYKGGFQWQKLCAEATPTNYNRAILTCWCSATVAR